MMFFGTPVPIAKFFSWLNFFVFGFCGLVMVAPLFAAAQINPFFDIKSLQEKQSISLKLGHNLTIEDPLFTKILQPFVDFVEAETEEKLDIVILPPSKNAFPQNLDEAVRKGQLSFAHLSLFDSDLYRYSRLIAFPYDNESPLVRAQTLWEMAHGALADEYKGLVLLSVHIDMGFFLHSGQRPETSQLGIISAPLLGVQSVAGKNILTGNGVMRELTAFFDGRAIEFENRHVDNLLREYGYGHIDGFAAAGDFFVTPAFQNILSWHYQIPGIAEPYIFVINEKIFNALPVLWQDIILRYSEDRMIEKAALILENRSQEKRWQALGHKVLRPQGAVAKAWQRQRRNFITWQLRKFDQNGFSTDSLFYNEFSLRLNEQAP